MSSESSLLVLTTISNSVLVGGLLTLIAGLTPLLRERLQLNDRGVLGLGATFVTALMLAMFLSGVLVDQWGCKQILIVSSLAAAFALAYLGLSRDYRSTLIASVLLGVAAGLGHIAVTVTMPFAFFPSEEADLAGAPAAANLGYVFVALGGVLVPPLAVVLLRRLDYQKGLLILALVAAFPGFVTGLTSGGSFPGPAQAFDLPLLFADWRFWVAVVAVFFFYALESSALCWAPNYLREIGLRDRTRTILLAAFWTIFLGARLSSAAIESTTTFTWLLLILPFLSAILLGNMIGLYEAGSGTTSFLFLAASLGPVFPTLAGMILLWFDTQPAAALGSILALGTLGRLAVPPVVNHLVGRQEVRWAMGITMVMGLIVVVPALIWVIMLSQ